MQLTDLRVVVTGASGALGAAVAHALNSAGARVAAVDHAPAPPATLAGIHTYDGIDLSDAKAAQTVIAKVAADLGGIDAVVNIAGTFRWEKVDGGSAATWDLLYNVNLRTAVTVIQAALPMILQQKRGGRIVNIGAAGAIKAGAGMGAYAASKAGIAKLTEALAEELKDRDVTVNALLPSIIDTPRNRADMPDAEFTRWVTVEQLADVILFLLSPAGAPITGALIPVTGRV